jgi:hypothetical protein
MLPNKLAQRQDKKKDLWIIVNTCPGKATNQSELSVFLYYLKEGMVINILEVCLDSILDLSLSKLFNLYI